MAARIKLLVLTPDDIRRLEGSIQSLTDMDPKFRPKARPVDYIAGKLSISPKIVQEWVRKARPLSRRTAITNLFWGAYERISDLLVEQIEAAVYTAATTTGGRDQMKAALFLLPRVHAERYGEVPDEETDDDVLSISDVEQEVFDAMNSDELEVLERQRQKVIEAQATTEALLKKVRAQVLAKEIAEDRVH
jgi:hypothetical protein